MPDDLYTKTEADAAIQAAIDTLVASAPGALDTLNELAAALGDDADFAGTVTTALAAKLAKASNLSDLTDAAAARTNLGVASCGARVYNSANVSIPNDTQTAVTFDSERFDTDGFHDAGSNPSRLTVPAGKAGYYVIGGGLRFAANGTNFRSISLLVNGTDTINAQHTNANAATQQSLVVSTLYYLNVGDYVEITAYQNSNGALNVVAHSKNSPEFWMFRVGI